MSFTPARGATVHTGDGRSLVLEDELGKGGEGTVWSVRGETSAVAKFYHKGLAKERARKIEAMCRLKSESLLRVAAWPTSLLRSSPGGSEQGLLMRRINGYREAHELYTPKSRRASFPEAQFPFILHVTINIVRAFASVHEAGQVIGDVNHGNLLVASDGTVALIDCDSFEITEGSRVFPCMVGVPTYTPPELQGQSFNNVRRSNQHDAFGLAILIFHMLFLGRHPFSGIFRQGTEDKTIEDAIREYRFVYSPETTTEMSPPPRMLTLAEIPSDVAQLFLRAFGRPGAGKVRPEAKEWLGPLESFSQRLRQCSTNETHQYLQSLPECPWCRVEQAFGRAMFGIRFDAAVGSVFDIAAIWARIESVDPGYHGPAAPSMASYAALCTPNPRIPEVRARRRTRRLLSLCTILIASVIVALNWLTALPAICVLVGGIAGAVKLWKLAIACAQEFSDRYKLARLSFDTSLRRWNVLQSPPVAFHATRDRLRDEKRELEDLPTVRLRRLAELSSNLRHKQLARHLERHTIESATIPGIGPGRKALLRGYGIEDASDVELSRLDIKGFGPSLRTALLVWRSSVESRFVFNPSAGVDQQDVRAVEQELAQRRAAVIRSLSNGPLQLKQALLPYQVERSALFSELTRLAQELAQADVEMAALRWF